MYEILGTNLSSILAFYVVIIGSCILVFPLINFLTEMFMGFKR